MTPRTVRALTATAVLAAVATLGALNSPEPFPTITRTVPGQAITPDTFRPMFNPTARLDTSRILDIRTTPKVNPRNASHD